MRYYIGLLYKELESAYGLRFPDLPGCFVAVELWDDIPTVASKAIDLWFAREQDVEPRSLDSIHRDPEVARAISQGAILLPVPYILADTALERVNISIERGLLRAIDETARSRGMTRSSFLAASARRELIGV